MSVLSGLEEDYDHLSENIYSYDVNNQCKELENSMEVVCHTPKHSPNCERNLSFLNADQDDILNNFNQTCFFEK